MSQVMPEMIRCAVCGAKSEQLSLISTNAFGSPDLDLRPPEMERSTMEYWAQKCSRCGYVADRLDTAPRIHLPFLKKDEYKKCLGLTFKSELAKTFFQQYLIQLAEKDAQKAFYAVLHAAWACDDEEDEENAVLCRKYALAEMDELLKKGEDETLLIQRADLLRRAGLFEKVIEDYEGCTCSEELLTRIAHFQVKRAYEGDISCYTVEDAMAENIVFPTMIEKAKGGLRSFVDLFKPKPEEWNE